MEEEEDDLYGTSNGPSAQAGAPGANGHDGALGQNAGEELEEGEEEEEEEEDSESDIEIVTERADLAEPTTSARFQKPEQTRDTPSTAPTSQQQSQSKPQPTMVRISSDTHQQPQAITKPILLPGDKYPALHTSTIDLDNVPLWNGKPVTELDIDADLAEQMKPWRRPGADPSEYFNYGFDEFTWATYCMRQSQMKGVLDEQKAESKMFETMMSGMGISQMPGMPSFPSNPSQNTGSNSPMPPSGPSGAPSSQAAAAAAAMGGGPGMMGMPNEQEMQQMFMQAMASQGASDPTQVDFGAFMQQFQQASAGVPMGGPGAGMGGGAQQGVPTGPGGGGGGGGNWQGGQGGGGGGGFQQGRGAGRGRRW